MENLNENENNLISALTKWKLDRIDYEEIISTLAKNGRPDLIQVFKKSLEEDPDPDFNPDSESESCSDTDSDTGEGEELVVGTTQDGFKYFE
tara:strand:+ start:11956 stop:12231 length:276 start_codon:yes stop_codon:yes gene_type:complete